MSFYNPSHAYDLAEVQDEPEEVKAEVYHSSNFHNSSLSRSQSSTYGDTLKDKMIKIQKQDT